ncbi:MAG TPA: M28 family peptidase [Tepidisphaeraceae bacterium]|nr:M28 family peptidase [Tepidisphaeraceae bacterium]
MRKKLISVVSISSLLAATLACNAVCRGAEALTSPEQSPSTMPVVPAGPHRDARFHIDMRQSVTYLASDELEGRLIGTPGIEKAADFIAANFSKLGLQTVPGLDGYFQPFKMTTRVDPDPAKTVFAVGNQTLKLGDDYVPLRSSAEAEAQGGVVFAGYGISDPTKHYDDYANLDVKGKFVLVMRFEPQEYDAKQKTAHSRIADKGEDWSTDAQIPQKVRAAVDHGAIGVILVNPALYHDDEGLIPFFRRYPFGAKVPVFQVSVAEADAMLKQGGAPDLKTLQTQIDTSLAPHGLALNGVSVRLAFAIKKTEKQVENVVAMLPGEGPHANEYVIVGSHYDHLGHGGPGSLAPWSHGIHHGADDNASGTTAMMELADRFAHLGPQQRSIIFIAFTGEEEGLIGSQHFASHPPIALDKVVGMLNLDMVGRLKGEKLLIGGEGTAANFVDLIKKADEGLPLKLGEFGKGGIGPSDHTSFALKKIPVLFFFTGLHMDYHRPTDTADKINYKGMDEVVELGERVVKAMTTMPPQKYNGSFDASGLLQMAGPTTAPSHGGSKATMGAIPDYSQGEEAKGGMRIGGIMPGSPAEKAGLKQGDVVTEFGGTKIDNMIDYTNALGSAKPGQTIKVKIIRDGKPMEIEATPAAKKES